MHFRSLPRPQRGLTYQIPFFVLPTPAREFVDMLFFVRATRNEESEQNYGEATEGLVKKDSLFYEPYLGPQLGPLEYDRTESVGSWYRNPIN